MKILTQNELITSLDVDSNVMFLLGAGCSISSGCMAAGALVLEFKKHLYCREHNVSYSEIDNYYEANFLKKLNEIYPDKENNYSYYFEKCFPVAKDRNEFIKSKFMDKLPNLGYLCFADYVITKKIPYILTTNFDRLIEKAIERIDMNYDLLIQTDKVQAYLTGITNLIKLHGDYNYDQLQNTENELKKLHDNMVKSLNSIKTNKIIVIGYSGYDDSVMSALQNYIRANPEIEIFWCVTDKNNISSKIEPLYEFRFNLVEIQGFDQLFNNYYKTYLEKNYLIEGLIEKNENKNFYFNEPLTQVQKIITNAYPLEKEPTVYAYDIMESNIELSAEKTLIQYKGKYYGFSKNYTSNIDGQALSNTEIPLNCKIDILKKYLIESFKNKNLNVYNNSIYKINNFANINPCLKFNISLVNNKFALILLPSYTYGRKPDINEYVIINNKISNLYAKEHHLLLNNLVNEYFNEMEFSCDKIGFSFSKKSYYVNFNKDEYENILNNYTLIKEPKMIINSLCSVNQIAMLQKIGPEEVPFSPEKIKVGVICCDEKKHDLYNNFLVKLINGSNTSSKTELINTFPGFKALLKKELEFVKNSKYSLKVQQLNQMDQDKLFSYLLEWVKDYYDNNNVNIVIIFFNKQMEKFRKLNNIDFHDYIKLKCLNKYKTQIIEESTLYSSDDINKKLFNFSLGIYTKTIGIPWAPLEFDKNNFYLGMSFGINNKGVHVGCSQLFDGAGRGMQLLVSPIENKNVRKNPYLNKEEAYNLGQRIRTLYYKSSKPFELNNIVIHRTTPFKKQEIEGFKQAFSGLNDFNLVQIVEYSEFNGYVERDNKYIDGFPIKRGTVIKISNSEILIWTAGSICDYEVLPNKTYRASKRGIGTPILVRKFYGKDSIEKIAYDILKLTKMDMNSTEVLHSRLPVTLKYAKVLCDLLKQGNLENDDEPINFQYIM